MVKIMFDLLLNFLVVADLIAFLLIICRSDKDDFFALFSNELIAQKYFDLFMLIVMCFLMLWLTIPISIYQIITDKNRNK